MIREWIDGEYLILDDWLSRATKGLSDVAAARVVEEIEGHYNESVAELIADGYRPGGAELEAIKRLGSPYKARRGYRREYPTVRDMRTFERYQIDLAHIRGKGASLTWREWYGVFCLGLVAFTFVTEGASDVHWGLPLSAMAVAMNPLAVRIAKREADRRGVKLGFESYLRMIAAFGAISLAYMAVLIFTSSVPNFVLGFVVLFFAFLMYRALDSWRKVRPFLEQ